MQVAKLGGLQLGGLQHDHGHGGAQTARRASCDASGLDNGTVLEVC